MKIVILGAGLMGRLLACQLARAGHVLEVYDSGGPDGNLSAARAAAAMLAPLAESAVTEMPVVQMGIHALRRWPELLAQLDAPVFFQQTGTLVIWHRQDAPEADRFMRQLDATSKALPQLPCRLLPLQPQALLITQSLLLQSPLLLLLPLLLVLLLLPLLLIPLLLLWYQQPMLLRHLR